MKNKENKKNEIIKTKSSTPGEDTMSTEFADKVLDWDGLLYRLMGDEDLAKEIVDDFMKDIPIKLNDLKEALHKGDALLVKREAHIIKGASGNVGAVALQEVAEQIEIASEAEDLVKARLFSAELDGLLEILKKNINKLYR